jgi:hypothetical protein
MNLNQLLNRLQHDANKFEAIAATLASTHPIMAREATDYLRQLLLDYDDELAASLAGDPAPVGFSDYGEADALAAEPAPAHPAPKAEPFIFGYFGDYPYEPKA